MANRILLIDDEEDIQEIISYNLIKEGYEVDTASNGKDGLAFLYQKKYDLVLLDVMMPEMDGIEVCETIRRTSGIKDTLICFLTARNEDYSQIAGLDAGGDDYVAKPIKPKVLVSRINAMLRRKGLIGSDSPFNEHQISVDRERYLLVKKGNEIILPRKEFELIALLMSKPEHVFDRDQILNSVWGTDIIVGNRTIDVHIRKLREKIGEEYIKTVKGIGYKFTYAE